MKSLKELKVEIIGLEDLLAYLPKNGLYVSENTYAYLIGQVKALKIELAELEAVERRKLRKMIISN